MTNDPDPSQPVDSEFGRLRIWYPSVGSTMDVASRLAAAGAPHGTVVEAGYQSAGRGRMGRAWEAPPGSSILTSWIMRLDHAPADPGVLSPLVALAVIRAIEMVAPHAPVGFKWPNDVQIDDRKVAGILLTSRASGDICVVIAGIGINLEMQDDAELRTSLREWRRDVTADEMRDRVAIELGRVWASFLINGALTPGDLTELERRLVLRDEVVELRLPDGVVRGQITGLASDGSLRLRRSDDGRIAAMRVGEIQRGPRKLAVIPPDSYRILPDASGNSDERPGNRERH